MNIIKPRLVSNNISRPTIVPKLMALTEKFYKKKRITRACLGRVSPLGRPRSVYKSNVECSFLSRNNGQMIWRSRPMTPIFNTSREYPTMHAWCQFGDPSPNLWWVIARRSRISYNSKSKWPKWPWRSRSMTSIFNTSRVYPRMHVWCKFGDSSPHLGRVIVRTSRIS